MSDSDQFGETPSLGCPSCGHGSSFQYGAAIGKTEWEEVECRNCGSEFEISAAIDAQLAGGADWAHGYRLFGGLQAVAQSLRCEWGTAALVDVQGVFERVHHVTKAMSGAVLAGGLSVQYMPTGHVMVAVAPSPGDKQQHTLNVTVTVIGRPAGESPMPAWRELFIEARKFANRSRRLPPILSVAAVDAFFSTRLDRDPEFRRRPRDWNEATEEITGRPLVELLGERRYSGDLSTALLVRNECAHDGDPKAPMSERTAEEESVWEKRHQRIHHDLQFAPSGKLVLEECLAVVRAVRREDRVDTRIVGRMGMIKA